MREIRTVPSLFALAALAACASTTVDPSADHERARELIRDATGRAESFDPKAPVLAEAEIDAILADGLGLDEALRLALLNNRRLQAGFAGLGVARADYVQSGLLKNPSLSLGLLIPSGGGRAKFQGELGVTLSELWELPRRREVQAIELDRRIVELSVFAGALVADTKDAYFECVAAKESHAVAEESARLATRGLEAVRQRIANGVATRTEEVLAQSTALAAELEARRAGSQLAQSARRLASLLSIEVDLLAVPFADELPTSDQTTFDREALAAAARESRSDLRAARRGLDAAEAAVALERSRRFGDVDAGVGFERPEGGSSTSFLAGPVGSIELPIFDQHQARIARAEFRRDELRKEYEALAIDALQSVRAAVDRAASTVGVARFVESDLLPRAETGAELARTAYEQGQTTLLPYLEAQRALAAARRTRVDARLDAARSAHDLEREIGRPLAGPGAPR